MTSYSQTLTSISELKWKYRVILVNGNESDLGVLFKTDSDIVDRDVIWFLFIDGSIHSNTDQKLSEILGSKIEKKHFKEGVNAVLIGKDGTVKSKQVNLNLKELMALIDTMPMRIQEMQRKL